MKKYLTLIKEGLKAIGSLAGALLLCACALMAFGYITHLMVKAFMAGWRLA